MSGGGVFPASVSLDRGTKTRRLIRRYTPNHNGGDAGTMLAAWGPLERASTVLRFERPTEARAVLYQVRMMQGGGWVWDHPSIERALERLDREISGLLLGWGDSRERVRSIGGV